MSFQEVAGERPVTPARVDGRRLRSERTRKVIIEAYLELLRRDPRIPTAAQIAAEAGYSTRSVFERFVDLNALTVATADYAPTTPTTASSSSTPTALAAPPDS